MVNVSFKISVTLYTFCLVNLTIDVIGLLKFSTVIELLSVFPFMSVNICFINLGGPMLGVCIFPLLHLL